MSGLEVAGFLLGILGPLQQSIELVESLRERRRAYRSNAQAIHRLLSLLNLHQQQLQHLQQQHETQEVVLPSEHRHFFERDIQQLRNLFIEMCTTLQTMDARCSKRSCTARITRFCMAVSVAGECQDLTSRLENANNILCSVRSLFVMVSAMTTNTEELKRHQSTKMHALQQTITDGMIAASNRSSLHDEFVPSKIRAWMPVGTVCDLNARDQQGNPSTVESRIKMSILSSQQTENVVIALYGEGGVGKTTILNALSVDDDIRNYFEHGIYSLTFGIDATEETIVDQICKVVRESGGTRTAIDLQAKECVKEVIVCATDWFRNKKVLLLADDIWNIPKQGKKLIYFLHEVVAAGRDSAIIYTTRDIDLATSTKAFRLRRREERESRSILLKCAGFNENDVFDNHLEGRINQLIQECHGLPVLLSVVGKVICEMAQTVEGEIQQVWEWFWQERRDLMEVEADRYGPLKLIFLTALRALSEGRIAHEISFELRYSYVDMHRALSVLRKQQWGPLLMLRFLWKLQTEKQAAEVVRHFASVGLLTKLYAGKGEQSVLGAAVHDLMHDYQRKETERHGDGIAWHLRVIDGYASSAHIQFADEHGCREWWKVNVNDANYFRTNIVRHLCAADLDKEAVTLATRPVWIATRLVKDGIIQYQQDLERILLRMCQNEDLQSIDGLQLEDVKLIKQAVTLGYQYVLEFESQVWFQLYARLAEPAQQSRSLQTYLRYISEHAPRPWIEPSLGCVTPAMEGTNMVASYESSVRCFDITRDGKTLWCGCSNGKIYSGAVGVVLERSRCWDTHSASLVCISFSRDETLAVTGSSNGCIMAWDVKNCTQIGAWKEAHKGVVHSVAISWDNKLVMSVGQDGQMRLCTLTGDETVGHVFAAHGGRAVRAVQMLSTKLVLSGGDDGEVKIWNVEKPGEGPRQTITCGSQVSVLAVSGDGRKVAVALHDARVKVWQVDDEGNLETELEGTEIMLERRATSLALSGDGAWLISGTAHGKVSVWNSSGEELGVMPNWSGATATGVAMIETEKKGEELVVWSSGSGTVLVSDAMRDARDMVTGVVRGVTLCNGDKYVVAGGDDGEVTVTEVATGAEMMEAINVKHAVSAANISVDGTRLVYGAHDGYVGVWDLVNRRELGTWKAGGVITSALSDDGKRLATAGGDRSVRIWDLDICDGRHETLEDAHEEAVWAVFFGDDDASTMVTMCTKVLYLWKDLKRVRKVNLQPRTNVLLERHELWWRPEVFRKVGLEVAAAERPGVVITDNKLFYVVAGEKPLLIGCLEVNLLPRHWEYSYSTRTVCIVAPTGVVEYLKLHT